MDYEIKYITLKVKTKRKKDIDFRYGGPITSQQLSTFRVSLV